MPGRVRNLWNRLFRPKANVKEVFGRANRVAGSRVVRTVAGTNKSLLRRRGTKGPIKDFLRRNQGSRRGRGNPPVKRGQQKRGR